MARQTPVDGAEDDSFWTEWTRHKRRLQTVVERELQEQEVLVARLLQDRRPRTPHAAAAAALPQQQQPQPPQQPHLATEVLVSVTEEELPTAILPFDDASSRALRPSGRSGGGGDRPASRGGVGAAAAGAGEGRSVSPAGEFIGDQVIPGTPILSPEMPNAWAAMEEEKSTEDSEPGHDTGGRTGNLSSCSVGPLEYGPNGWVAVGAGQAQDGGCSARSRSERHIEEYSLVARVARKIRVYLKSWDAASGPKQHPWRRKMRRNIIRLADWWVQLEEPRRDGCVHDFISSPRFDMLCALVIMLNSVYTALAADYEIQQLSSKPTDEMIWAELFFLLFYLIEIILKLAVHKHYFFCNQEMTWNIFDFFLVVLALTDWITIQVGGISGGNMNFARSLRVFKLGKILRMFRVMRFMRELRVMMASIIGSFISLFWSLIMLGMIVYVFALVFVQAITLYLLENRETIHTRTENQVYWYFGSVERTSRTLYQATTGGMDWEIAYNLIAPCGWVYAVAFIFYIAFWTFAVMNILTGIFVDNAMKLAAPDREQVMLEQRRKVGADAEELRRLCQAMDLDGNGTLGLEEFTECLQDDRVEHYLATLGLEVKDASLFFQTLMQVSGEDELCIDDFVDHCMRMKGMATSIDLQGLILQTKRLHRDITTMRREMDRGMRRIEEGTTGGADMCQAPTDRSDRGSAQSMTSDFGYVIPPEKRQRKHPRASEQSMDSRRSTEHCRRSVIDFVVLQRQQEQKQRQRMTSKLLQATHLRGSNGGQ